MPPRARTSFTNGSRSARQTSGEAHSAHEAASIGVRRATLSLRRRFCSNEKESKYRGQLSDLCGITEKCEDILQQVRPAPALGSDLNTPAPHAFSRSCSSPQIDQTLSCFDKIITQQQTIGASSRGTPLPAPTLSSPGALAPLPRPPRDAPS